ncbi:hypothetical protein [Sphingomonas turrisvirgatae]|jgi:hypothetical protein|uniref:Uncharacterized protein n=1 Tax=Sphingomonas turrisvirgatae TaxID=1888892 RepID=A0A1E3LX93_9SPHN|nr:hypothetical protein [Sphingomonas turrisvirgatae]ODP38407.1 hypothetical protein BFL28_14270 [Sphingomonas turrisvirgatae]
MYAARAKRTYPSIWRVILAFVVVPGAAALLMAIVMPAYEGITDPLERIWRSAVAFAVFGAYPPAFIIGLPAFFMLRRHVDATIINCAATGAVVAALPWLVLALLSRPDNASIGGRSTVINGSLTAYGWLMNFYYVGQIALLGTIAGALFWFIAAAGSRAGKVEQI